MKTEDRRPENGTFDFFSGLTHRKPAGRDVNHDGLVNRMEDPGAGLGLRSGLPWVCVRRSRCRDQQPSDAQGHKKVHVISSSSLLFPSPVFQNWHNIYEVTD